MIVRVCKGHSWLCILYNDSGEEIGWICDNCGLVAQREPLRINMEEMNEK